MIIILHTVTNFMNDEYTRKNRVAKMTLEMNLNMPYLIALGIIGVLFIMVLGDPDYSLASRIILYIFLGIVAYLMYQDYQKKKSEIQEIFED